jgi:SAM-dependent methyltransferase
MKCRSCGTTLELVLIDLGSSPLSNAYLTPISLRRPEKWFPLRVLVCQKCWLVQAESYSRAAEIFNDEYAYFSSFSDAWMAHSQNYFEYVREQYRLDSSSFVLEVASNDGYLLQHFVGAGIPCLGVEPTASTATAAKAKGVPTIERFFGQDLAMEIVDERGLADLWIGNNVLAHVPDPQDFLNGVRVSLKEAGVATFEFPHLMNLIEGHQFDTIYHEHFAYLSFTASVDLMQKSGLEIFRVDKLPTHGGSLRIFVRLATQGLEPVETSVQELLDREHQAGMLTADYYAGFQEKALKVKDDFLRFLLDAKTDGKSVAGYGAAAKGNTLLNYGGVGPDSVRFVVDRNPSKQGKYLPGSRIPIVGEDVLKGHKPDFIVIFPWNIKEEVMDQLAYAREWGAQFVTAIPCLETYV